MTLANSIVVVAVAACGSSPAVAPDAGAPDSSLPDAGSGTTALFARPAAASEFYELPFPNDLRVRADGTLDLDALPRPNGFYDTYLGVMASEFRGFGRSSPVYVRFSGPIDDASLPIDARDPSASVYLVDVGATSPTRGQRTPLACRFRADAGATIGANSLACLPVLGMPLAERTTYAFVVTRRLRAGGSPVAASPDFPTALAGEPAYAPLRDWLDEPGGDERADVVDAAVFTTADTSAWMAGVRASIAKLPVPTARDVVPGDDGATFHLFAGTFDSPNLQTGTPPFSQTGGALAFDATGNVIVQAIESRRFAVSVPSGPVPATGWPLVIYAHGTGGDFESFVGDGTADRMAQAGLAVISIDQPLHGARAVGGGQPGFNFFNALNPVAWRDNIRQSAADDVALVRLIPALSIADADGRTHGFDTTELAFMGHSQGGITGAPFIAFEPSIHAAVMSGTGGLMALTLPYKASEAPTFQTLIADGPLDEYENFLALLQAFFDIADPVSFAGVYGRDLYQSEGIVDADVPAQAIEAFGIAARLAPATPIVVDVPGFAVEGIAPVTAPVIGNRANGSTGVFVQYATTGDGHFVVFEVPQAQRQHVQFLATALANGRASLVP